MEYLWYINIWDNINRIDQYTNMEYLWNIHRTSIEYLWNTNRILMEYMYIYNIDNYNWYFSIMVSIGM